MLADLLNKVSLFTLLYRIDEDLAREIREQRCPYCGGPLHYSNYVRKPRGGPQKIPDECLVRLSLCCGRQDCRKRTLPPSCRFTGRRVYWGAVILVVMALKQGRAHGASANSLMRLFGISRNTLRRWFAYFREIFPSSPKWMGLRGSVSACVQDCGLPTSLLQYFLDHSPTAEQALVACLRFLA